jgi:hypothetical protein
LRSDSIVLCALLEQDAAEVVWKKTRDEGFCARVGVGGGMSHGQRRVESAVCKRIAADIALPRRGGFSKEKDRRKRDGLSKMRSKQAALKGGRL